MRSFDNARFALVAWAVLLVAGALSGPGSGPASALGQTPTPQAPGSQIPDLKPAVRLVSVSLNGGAPKTVGGSLTGLPAQVADFEVPRNPATGTSWALEVRTSEGRGTINFSNTVPAGVPASAFQWEQSSGASPSARGTLRYNGCAGCPASFTFEVSVKDSLDFSGAAPKAHVRLNLTASGGPPRLLNIERSGGDSVHPRFQLTFASGTFAQEDSQVVGTYSGGLKVRLLTEYIGAETLLATIPRLKASRNVQVTLRNPYGTSSNLNVDLPIQEVENGPRFDCVTCSITSGEASAHNQYSIKHVNVLPGDASGTDEIAIAPRRSGVTPCDQPDFIYHTALVSWIRTDGYSGDSADQGTVRVSDQPPVDNLLRSPNNKIRIAWTLKGLKGERWYQVVFGVIDVVGICPDRIVQ